MDRPIQTIRIFVQIDKNTQKKLEFTAEVVTGLEIKVAAGIPNDLDLARKDGSKLELVTNDQQVAIHNGNHFVVFPPGTIS